MSITGTGKYHPLDNRRKGQIYVPSDVVKDSTFPFDATTAVSISILHNAVLIKEKND